MRDRKSMRGLLQNDRDLYRAYFHIVNTMYFGCFSLGHNRLPLDSCQLPKRQCWGSASEAHSVADAEQRSIGGMCVETGECCSLIWMWRYGVELAPVPVRSSRKFLWWAYSSRFAAFFFIHPSLSLPCSKVVVNCGFSDVVRSTLATSGC